MKLAIIINSNDPETAWNALRLGNTALGAGHEVSVFLMGSGVEVEEIKSEKFNVTEVLKKFLDSQGNLLACGTCLKVRQQEAGVCPVSTMPQLVQLIVDSDKVVTFG
ncbi:MAG: sulfur reduction protein DsrE [Chloroflexi bacterium RBG_16_50_9]|nr:MAG: sulfur reduction protein DsrE [Chloroflexi bacterium RBG_16_50_9]